MSVVKILCYLLLTYHLSEAKKNKGNRAVDTEQRGVLEMKEPHVSSSVFRLLLEGEDNCALDPVQLHTLTSCGFNSSNPLIIITHGWSVDGMMESWVLRLATTLKTSLIDVNVIMTDWMSLAHQHYPRAAQGTRIVGKDIAHLLQSLQEHYQYALRKVHLIGYSLGAHISGFAGSYLKGSEKIGRITGLDPAGPLFEGMSPTDRLSPDDAEFVDAIHTFTHERMGLSVGIKQAVAHYDFYPNGGDFQPGCDLQNIYEHIAQYGLNGFEQTVKCAHERSVHLFIDSLLNKDKQSMAYRCSDKRAFDKGVCLDCRKNRCNTLGYNIKKVHSGTSKSLYLKTRSRMPYKLYHYQFRIQFVNQMERIKPSLTISLSGTKDESGNLPITVPETIWGNRTFTFLITLDKDLGDLMLLRLHWEGSDLWKNVWNRVQNIIPWGGPERKPHLTVGKISMKAGDTQKRTSFCAMTNEDQQVDVSQNKVFVRCQDNTPKQRRGKHNRHVWVQAETL
ncbi:Hepatic triacylglycerol lipase [Larimichthys crocea]|uniref:Hepatic triacylglycerol lipase n=1 Tax=Larimichthys crocea TaxID=215358 RepID=A0A6G0IZW8_LARCR|nr:hepatic triacylglycerol lipase isoform X2 [Larimichthys crocea]KAE8297065.1 Hepatic triacylglycerol lipase [Larimichthys crocea]